MKKIVMAALAVALMATLALSVVPSSVEAALSPWLQNLEAKYVIVGDTWADASGIQLKLNNDGLRYGETWGGARNLAIYAAVRYYQSQGKQFPRPVTYGWNAVDAEIHDHCHWALGKGYGRIPALRARANPVNIGLNDMPPFWK